MSKNRLSRIRRNSSNDAEDNLREERRKESEVLQKGDSVSKTQCPSPISQLNVKESNHGPI
jgi:hypothetical protein